MLESSIAIGREIGSALRIPAGLTNLGELESDAGNFDRAAALLEEALTIDQQQARRPWCRHRPAIAGRNQPPGRQAAGGARPARRDVRLYGQRWQPLAPHYHPGDVRRRRRRARRRSAGGSPVRRRARDAGAVWHLDIGFRREAVRALSRPARRTVAAEAWETELACGRALGREQAVSLLTSLTAERGTLR